MPKNHRRARSAEKHGRAQNACDGQRLHRRRAPRRQGESLDDDRDTAQDNRRTDDDRSNRRKGAADRGPVQNEGGLRKGEGQGGHSRKPFHFASRRTKRERDRDEDRRQPCVESKELHAHFARDEEKREDDAPAKVAEKQE